MLSSERFTPWTSNGSDGRASESNITSQWQLCCTGLCIWMWTAFISQAVARFQAPPSHHVSAEQMSISVQVKWKKIFKDSLNIFEFYFAQPAVSPLWGPPPALLSITGNIRGDRRAARVLTKTQESVCVCSSQNSLHCWVEWQAKPFNASAPAQRKWQTGIWTAAGVRDVSVWDVRRKTVRLRVSIDQILV